MVERQGFSGKHGAPACFGRDPFQACSRRQAVRLCNLFVSKGQMSCCALAYDGQAEILWHSPEAKLALPLSFMQQPPPLCLRPGGRTSVAACNLLLPSQAKPPCSADNVTLAPCRALLQAG